MNYLIKVSTNIADTKYPDGYAKSVKGYPVKFKGFENIEFFAYKDDKDWGITEVKTGLAIINPLAGFRTKKDAIESATRRLNAKGEKVVLDIMKDCKLVTEYPIKTDGVE
jgi:hypothetical protein